MPSFLGSPWRKGAASLLVREDGASTPGGKIAGFDLNDTLVSSKVGAPGYQVTVSDWTFYSPAVPKKLKELHKDGFRLVIFTNQGNIRSALDGKRSATFKASVDAFLKDVGVPILVLASTQRDDFRKPKMGMWQYLETKANGSISVNKELSFYVGDAAGAPGEHSADDADFAKAIGLRFIHTKDFFGLQGELTEQQEQRDTPPKKAPRLAAPGAALAESIEEGVDFQLPQGKWPDPPLLLVLVGLPGCGKTSFAQRLGPTFGGDSKSPSPWRRVCQDLLRSKEACLRAASACLDQGLSVIIDRTDINVEQRAPWAQLAKSKGATCHALIFDVPLEECCRRAQHRQDHEGGLRGGSARPVIMKLHKMQQAVDAKEGFARVQFLRDGELPLQSELRRYGVEVETAKSHDDVETAGTNDNRGDEQRKVQLLKSMGFEEGACVQALEAARGDTNAAANQLLAERLLI